MPPKQLLTALTILLISCGEETARPRTTRFSGIVAHADSTKTTAGFNLILVAQVPGEFLSPSIYEKRDSLVLDSAGGFSFQVGYHKRETYSFRVLEPGMAWPLNTDCSPIECGGLSPGQDHHLSIIVSKLAFD